MPLNAIEKPLRWTAAWFEGDPLAGEYRFYAAHNRHFLAGPPATKAADEKPSVPFEGSKKKPRPAPASAG